MKAVPPSQPSVPSPTANTVLQAFDVGKVRVTIVAPREGGLVRFLLHRANPASPGRVLIGSGSTHDRASCVDRATGAARRAGGAA